MWLGLVGCAWLAPLELAAQRTEKAEQPPSSQPDVAAPGEAAAGQSSFQKPSEEVDQRRRRELLSFVRENHPELEPLVLSLKDKLPLQYESAIRSIDKSVTQLQAIQSGGNQQRYSEALEYWKLNSRIQLLSAQLSLDDTPARRKQLKRLITKQFDVRQSQLVADRERTSERLERLNEAIEKAQVEREAEINQRLESVIRIAERTRAKRESTADDLPNSSNKISPTPVPEKKGNGKGNNEQTNTDENE